MNDNENIFGEPAASWRTVEPVSFEQLMLEYESTRPAKEYKPITFAEEEVPVVIYGPEEEPEIEKTKVREKPKKAVRPKLVRPRRLLGAVTVGVFAVLLFLISAVNTFTPDREYSDTENRTLAKRPDISFTSIKTGSFMSRFETYMSDQFIFRDSIVSLRSRIEQLLGKSEQNGVYIGKDGWLFERQTKYDASEVESTIGAIKAFSDSCKIKNQAFALVPNSSFIISDKLPKYLTEDDQRAQIYSVYEQLPENNVCIDTTAALLAAKNIEALYYKTDHHWTTRASMKVFTALADEWGLKTDKVKYEYHTLSNSFFGTLAASSGIYDTPDRLEVCIPANSESTYIVQNPDLQTKSTSMFDLSKLDSGNQYEVFFGGNYSRLIISTTNRNGKSLLVFKDSYANCMIPMLTPYFQQIVVIDARYFTEELSDVLKDSAFTHLLYLYNVNTFLEDSSLRDVLE